MIFKPRHETMKTSKLAIMGFLAMVGSTWATTINGGSLQTILNNITDDGSSSIDVQADQVALDQYWTLTASGGSVATMIIELAGYADFNAFGVYDAANPSSKVTLFSGVAASGDQALLSIKSSGAVYVNFANTGVVFQSKNFGYFLSGPGGLFYSDGALNSDQLDHMVAFQGQGDAVTLPGYNSGTWSPNEYVLGWEDVAFGDNDFDDMVVMVESVEPVPEPATFGLMGLGLIGLGFFARRKKTA
jgi:Domain of unknown function (DUF4114)/PEP-CTERM motif